MRNRRIKVIAVCVAAVVAGAVWALLPVGWSSICSVANSCGFPLARIGRGYTLLSHAAVVYTTLPGSYNPLPLNIAVNFVMATAAIFASLVGGRGFKITTAAWFLLVMAAAIVRGAFFAGGYAAAIGKAVPMFYFPVAVFGIAAEVMKSKGFSAMFGWLGFAAFFFLTMLLPVNVWILVNLPALGLNVYFQNLADYLTAVGIITAVDALFFGYAIYAFCRMKLPLKLGAGGCILALACVGGLIGDVVVFLVMLELLIFALACYGLFFLNRRNGDLDDDAEAVPADDVTYVNTVLAQEKMAEINPDKTTFFHIGEHEEFDDKGNKITKKKNDDDIKL